MNDLKLEINIPAGPLLEAINASLTRKSYGDYGSIPGAVVRAINESQKEIQGALKQSLGSLMSDAGFRDRLKAAIEQAVIDGATESARRVGSSHAFKHAKP